MSAAPYLRIVPSDDVDGRIPPNDLDAEAAVLSASMLDPLAIPKIIDFLRPEHFYSEAHRRIFEACCSLFHDKSPVDIQTVGSWLRARDRLGQVGGGQYLADILAAAPVVQNVRAYALTVHDCWRRRQVIVACQRATAVGYVQAPDVQRYIDDTVKALAGIGAQNPLRPVEGNREALERILISVSGDDAEAATRSHGQVPIPTGIPSLDRLIFGLRRKAKTCVAAESGVGKTALALQIAIHVASHKIAVLFFSTELMREELLRRAVSARSGVPNERIKRRELGRSELPKIFEACNFLKDLPLRIDETARLSIEQIRATTKAFAEESMLLYRIPLGLVVVDYVQRLKAPRHLLQREERVHIEDNTRELKMLAQELDVAVLELAQANPKDPRNPKKERTIYGSGTVRRESDEVIFMEPEPAADEEPNQEIGLDLRKQRDGKKGVVRTIFRRPIFRFDDPNAMAEISNPSRQYVDEWRDPHDDDHNPITEGL